jgi:hypothetical protein
MFCENYAKFNFYFNIIIFFTNKSYKDKVFSLFHFTNIALRKINYLS